MVAEAAERLGLHSVWTFERLLLPVTPTGTNPYGLPDHNATVYDPLETLSWVAARYASNRTGNDRDGPAVQSPWSLPSEWRPWTGFPEAGCWPARPGSDA